MNYLFNKQNLFIFLCFGILISSLIGVLINYTFIPKADMWSNFELIKYIKFDHDYSFLISQHNEHRILIPRLIYIADYIFFGGNYYFLYLLNIILLISTAYIMQYFFALSSEKYRSRTNQYYLIYFWFSIAGLFFWAQSANLIWAYQSQFLLAYIFPILSLLFVFKDFLKPNVYLYITALLFCIFSILTMANGLFTLLVVAIFYFFNNFKIRSLITFAIFIVVFSLYFCNFTQIEEHANPFFFLTNIMEVIFFYLCLSGNFISFFVGKGQVGIFLAGLYGLLFNLLFLYYFYRDKKNLLLYICLFILISFLAIASGRYNLGLKAAISSRYVTPAIISSIFLLFYSLNFVLKMSFNKQRKILFYTLFLFLPYQISAFSDPTHNLIKKYANVISFSINGEHDIPHFESKIDAKYYLDNDILLFGKPFVKKLFTQDHFLFSQSECTNLNVLVDRVERFKSNGKLLLIESNKLMSDDYLNTYDEHGQINGQFFKSKNFSNFIYKANHKETILVTQDSQNNWFVFNNTCKKINLIYDK